MTTRPVVGGVGESECSTIIGGGGRDDQAGSSVGTDSPHAGFCWTERGLQKPGNCQPPLKKLFLCFREMMLERVETTKELRENCGKIAKKNTGKRGNLGK